MVDNQKEARTSSIAVLGLGNMGAALARAFVKSGHRVSVWNRHPEKSQDFAGKATIAPDAAAACRGAELVVACLASYAATMEVLDQPGMHAALADTVLVQLSTGTPDQARVMAARAAGRSRGYLDGKIAVTPGRIGDGMTVVFYAGSKPLFEAHRPVLACLGGRPIHVGEDVGKASLADFAFLSFYFAGIVGILHGAAFCQAADLELAPFLDAMPSFAKEMIERLPSFREMMEGRDFRAAQSTLKVDLAGAKLLAEVAASIGLAEKFPAFLVDVFDGPVRAGMGDLDTAALTEVFRRR